VCSLVGEARHAGLGTAEGIEPLEPTGGRRTILRAMDDVIAARMAQELAGKQLGGWTIGAKIGRGKSAIVFRATMGKREAALKVFDRELVQRCGKDEQRERGKRERSLLGVTHDNLIEILDAGEDAKLDYFFVAMALFEGKNLADALPDVPSPRVPELIWQLAQAARFLEEKGYAHRDIKPENIGVSGDFSTVVLLDFGVLHPPGGLSNITDDKDKKTFLGTLQYSPPELLHRKEDDTPEAWRAITFYQLGAVLHDLLTRTPLFTGHLDPYATLVEAVTHVDVTIKAPDYPAELAMLARHCLQKKPAHRLLLVNWESFAPPSAAVPAADSAAKRIAARRLRASLADRSPSAPPVLPLAEVAKALAGLARDAVSRAELPPFECTTGATGTAASIRLRFDPARFHAIDRFFVVFLEGAVVDPAARLVQVRVAAAIAETAAQTPEATDEAHFSKVFVGLLPEETLPQLTAALQVAFDWAQALCEDAPTQAIDWYVTGGGAHV
jgi:hypothetical protein